MQHKAPLWITPFGDGRNLAQAEGTSCDARHPPPVGLASAEALIRQTKNHRKPFGASSHDNSQLIVGRGLYLDGRPGVGRRRCPGRSRRSGATGGSSQGPGLHRQRKAVPPGQTCHGTVEPQDGRPCGDRAERSGGGNPHAPVGQRRHPASDGESAGRSHLPPLGYCDSANPEWPGTDLLLRLRGNGSIEYPAGGQLAAVLARPSRAAAGACRQPARLGRQGRKHHDRRRFRPHPFGREF